MEVYNESLRDLLAEGKGRDVGKLPDTNVIRHHPAGTILREDEILTRSAAFNVTLSAPLVRYSLYGTVEF